MTSLHLEHDTDDLDAWLATFGAHADLRTERGVLRTQVRCGADDRNHIAVDLEFASAEAALAFLDVLQTQIWPSSPHLVGSPSVRVLESVDVAA